MSFFFISNKKIEAILKAKGYKGLSLFLYLLRTNQTFLNKSKVSKLLNISRPYINNIIKTLQDVKFIELKNKEILLTENRYDKIDTSYNYIVIHDKVYDFLLAKNPELIPIYTYAVMKDAAYLNQHKKEVAKILKINKDKIYAYINDLVKYRLLSRIKIHKKKDIYVPENQKLWVTGVNNKDINVNNKDINVNNKDINVNNKDISVNNKDIPPLENQCHGEIDDPPINIKLINNKITGSKYVNFKEKEKEKKESQNKDVNTHKKQAMRHTPHMKKIIEQHEEKVNNNIEKLKKVIDVLPSENDMYSALASIYKVESNWIKSILSIYPYEFHRKLALGYIIYQRQKNKKTYDNLKGILLSTVSHLHEWDIQEYYNFLAERKSEKEKKKYEDEHREEIIKNSKTAYSIPNRFAEEYIYKLKENNKKEFHKIFKQAKDIAAKSPLTENKSLEEMKQEEKNQYNLILKTAMRDIAKQILFEGEKK